MSPAAPHVLLFSPDLEGHREVYCRVAAALLVGMGCRVSVAGRMKGGAGAPAAYPHIVAAADESGVAVFDVGEDPRDGARIDWCRLRARARGVGADVVVLMEADAYLPLLADRAVRSAVRHRPGADPRVVGLFVRSSNYIHEPIAPRAPLRAAVSSLRRLRAVVAGDVDRRLFHELAVPLGAAVDAALCLDERFAVARGGRHGWLPDIFAGPDLDERAGEETTSWGRRLDAFLSEHPQAPVVVYTGWADARRGYADLLRLADETGGVFLHCGETARPPDPLAAQTRRLRERLAAAGRLLETGTYYRSAETAAGFLRRARCVALPYDHHLGSSGAMLQALAARRPVLVPDEGLMAWRVRCFGLGETYPPGDWDAMAGRFAAMERGDAAGYGPAIDAYMAVYDDVGRAAALRWAVLGVGSGASLPGRPGGGSSR